MKQKKIQKRLVLNKKTVAHLNGGEMSDAKGGVVTPTIFATLGWPDTCFCSINTQPHTCCNGCDIRTTDNC